MEFKPDAVIRFSELPKNISGSGSLMWKYYIKPMLNYICRRFDNRYIPIDQQMNTIDTVQNIDNKLKSIYKRIYDNHKNDLFKPVNVYVSKKSRVRPNYMLQYANNDYKTFYFLGTPFIKFSIFSKNNLMPPISFKELQQIFNHN
ncbi:hypothetical protein LN736_18160 [Clostridium sp. WLY-B-L2]|uniref:Uncharacterized protein n=1 Tax=Clostridium aromativorans TaxID=2836848 RepID=A0ABS8NAT0_9CLOT|nr:hypothetical protein [Clostridium aromativorans]MCC9296761.1 hypothetical protein [Clostridium aromativorans]